MADQKFRNELANLRRYVPGKPIEEVKRELGLDHIVKLASNENPLGPSPKAIDAIQKEATRVHIYPDSVAMELREALSARFQMPVDQIILGNGGEEILKLIAGTFINAGDEAICAKPSFDLYDTTVIHMGGVAHTIPLTLEYKHDFPAFLEKINDKTKLVYVCNPNNPTGNIMTNDELEVLLKDLPPHIVLVLDEAYYDYACIREDYPNGLAILKNRPNTIVLRTFSKVAGLAGVRVGYAFSSAEIITEMTKIKGVFNVNKIAQAAALAALEDHDHINKTVKLNYASLGKMIAFFEQKGLRYLEPNANFVLVDVGRSSKEVFDQLLKKGVIIRPGYLWGLDQWLRVSSGTMEETEYFIEKLSEILG